jgi:hypothetical protein
MKTLNDFSNSAIGSFSNHTHKIKAHDHLVHFYETKNTLIHSVCDFIVPSLTSQQGVILIASKEHLALFESALEKRSIDIAKAMVQRRLICLDAHALLEKFMDNGLPNSEKFFPLMHEIMGGMKGFSQIRAFGEMVNILWHQGNHEGAVSLENLWNELIKFYNVSLFCGYEIDEKSEEKNFHSLSKVCHAHTHIISKDGILKSLA